MTPARIIVIRLSSMGDVIHTLPAAASLKHSFPQSRVSWIVRPKWAPLLADNPYIDEVIPVERSLRASLACAARVRSQGCDLAVDFQGLVQTALLGAAMRPEKFVGFSRGSVREFPAVFFYSSGVHVRASHVVDRNLELAAGAGATNLLRVFPLPAGSAEVPAQTRLGTLPEGPFVLASPFAGWGSKQWPMEFWAKLSGLLELPLVVNGPPGTESEISRILGARVHISGISGLIHATRRAHAVVGVDSGPMHLAAALGKPGVAIFGPTDPARNGPYGGSLSVLRDASAVTDYRRAPTPAASMRAITPAMVSDTLRMSLANSVEGRRA